MSNIDQSQFADLEALLNASMDDIEDLPPMGVPPTGHYNLSVDFSIAEVGDDNIKVPCLKYTIEAVNELKDDSEASEAIPGGQFTEFFYLAKKDGTANKFGIGKLKARTQPIGEGLGHRGSMGELFNQIKDIKIACHLKRTVNKKNPENYNVDLSNIVLL